MPPNIMKAGWMRPLNEAVAWLKPKTLIEKLPPAILTMLCETIDSMKPNPNIMVNHVSLKMKRMGSTKVFTMVLHPHQSVKLLFPSGPSFSFSPSKSTAASTAGMSPAFSAAPCSAALL
eukprot:CAMPEP_0180635542 /NCGR_PEP_ID=MMETSP1037_2-20121125/42699_1 /TAXON_ID=632150 /ORGANISM="Azadinium spinosum, Strain 3D9" /LENGTH=118 /DNA_ID=CAMNT_0022656715 /DNA_START=241 /DNA_END=597 /DNA_ORIENTATION=+